MKNLIYLFIIIICNSCYPRYPMGDALLCNYIGDVKCTTNYSVFQIPEAVNINRFGLGKMDTTTLEGKKYENVFFAQVSEALINNVYVPNGTLIVNKTYVLFSKHPMARGTIKCKD
jgi:hypothetical protein